MDHGPDRASSEAYRTAPKDGTRLSMESNKDDIAEIREDHTDVRGVTACDEPAAALEDAPEVVQFGVKEAAELVRAESRAGGLTDPAVFAKEPFSFADEELAQVMDDLDQDEAYADIVRIADERSGAEYLHSTTFLTVAYARHAIRARANDSAFLIAQTVRENSEIYPKPTSLEFFEFEPFGLGFDDILANAKAILADEACADIRSVTVSNGMVYLYSDKFLSEGQAQAMAQWVEVDMYLDSNK